MVELRKRPAPPPSAAPPPAKRRSSASSNNKNSNKSTAKPQETKLEEKSSLSTEQTENSKPGIFGDKQCLPASTSNKELAVGDTVDFNSGIGSIEVTTHEGKIVTLKTLYGQSDGGIVIFTYPKASTPGCTTQAQLFRDSHAALTGTETPTKTSTKTPTNLTIYGLSTDTPKANSTFKAKHNLPYTLLCDPSGTLVRALGMGNSDPKKKTPRRGVVVIGHDGEVKVAVKAGPAATVEAVKAIC